MRKFLSTTPIHRSISARFLISRNFSSKEVAVKDLINDDPHNNIGESIALKYGENLHQQKNHPLCIIKNKIQDYFGELKQSKNEPEFIYFDDLSPIVSTKACFDDLLTPKDHVSRQSTDTYYVNQTTLLRPHTSAHQSTLIGQKHKAFLVSGDVYRRDEIDASHYPVFHQMEGVRLFPEIDPSLPRSEKVDIVQLHLKNSLEGMVKSIFGDVEMRWVDAYFPFTDPSFELEIFFNGDWLEVLGCGVIQQKIVQNADLGEEVGWAFGLGLERLAMVLFGIPDIRLFWSKDPRFISQFKAGEITQFNPYSKYPPCYKDVSFWLSEDFHENNMCEAIRDIAGDIVEQVSLVDNFEHPTTKRVSNCYRLTFRHMDRNLTNEEVDGLQALIRKKLVADLGVELR